MLRKIDRVKKILLVVLSSLLLSLSFPNFNLEFLAWFSFVPLFFALRECAKKEAFLLAFFFGFFFFGLTIFWVHHVSILGYILLISILSVFFGIFGIFLLSAIPAVAGSRHELSRVKYKRDSYQLSVIFIIPAFWVVLEYIRSNLFTGFGWVLLGYSQYLNLPVIQISDLLGASGVSFLVMMINVIIYSIFSNGFKKSMSVCLVGLLIIFSVLGYGYLKLSPTKTTQKDLSISLIQGNIPQNAKWDTQLKDYIFNTYSRLTKDASKDNPDLIIWPETALPGFIEENDLLEKVKSLAKDVSAYLLVGAPSYADSRGETIFNSAFLISKEGKIVGQYNKLHLVPFGEYIPLGRYLDFLRNFIDKPIGDFKKGGEYTIFELEDGLRFGVLICFEDIFSNLVRNFVRKRADFMVNITNDAWFMKTGAPYQHAQVSVFRAVENRVPLVRAANTGFSCFIDEDGRIIDSVKVGNEQIFVTGYKTRKITLSNSQSLYCKFGEVFTFFCMTVILMNGCWKWLRRYL